MYVYCIAAIFLWGANFCEKLLRVFKMHFCSFKFCDSRTQLATPFNVSKILWVILGEKFRDLCDSYENNEN